jgi:hypothetical protein
MRGLALEANGVMTPLPLQFPDLFSIQEIIGVVSMFSVLTVPLIYVLPKTKKIDLRKV